MDHRIIYKDKNSYSCFPDIAKDREGGLWVSFRRAGKFSLQAVERGQYDHVDRGARIAIARSKDLGKSWRTKVLPPFDPDRGEQDPSIQILRDGTFIINFFQWRVVPGEQKRRLKYPSRQQSDGSWADVEGPSVIRSFDGGSTWETEPVPVDSAPLPRAGTSDSVLELPDGTLIMGIYGADYGSKVCHSYSVLSSDGGASWSKPALIAKDKENNISFEEPALALTNDGCIMAMLRAGESGNYGQLYQAYSRDLGHSWEDLRETSIVGHPAALTGLSDGRMLCTYGYRREPFGVRGCFSHDNGTTWKTNNEIIIRNDGASRDVGYPSTVELDDGSLFTVYYIHTDDGIRHIAGTKWNE